MPSAATRDPVYLQVNELLRALLRGEEFSPGSRFLTERQVSERFGISRITANKALSSLVAEGVLEFRKGVGTFVQAARLDYDLGALVSFTEKALALGVTPETQVLRFRLQSADEIEPEDLEWLGGKPDEPIYSIRRLRLADGAPLILERRLLRAKFCPDLEESMLTGSLYGLLTEHYGLKIVGAQETIQAVTLRSKDADRLGVKAGSAALQVSATGLLEGDVPLWFERTLYRADRYEFRNRLGPVAHARPAEGKLVDVVAKG